MSTTPSDPNATPTDATPPNAMPTNKTRAENIPAIERATAKSWADWLAYFESEGAAKLPHNEIAVLARAQTPSELYNPEWWAQAVAIAYEQHVGLRVPGQSSSSTFRVSASRTFHVDRTAALALWVAQFGELEEHLGHAVSKRRESETAKRSFHRFSLEGGGTADGEGKVEVSATVKTDSSSILVISHEGLVTGDRIEEWRAYWKAQLAQL